MNFRARRITEKQSIVADANAGRNVHMRILEGLASMI